MDWRTRKLMTMNKALHLRYKIDRLHVSRKGGGRRLASIEESVDPSMRGLKDYIKKSKERLITAVNNSTENIRTEKTTKTKKQK